MTKKTLARLALLSLLILTVIGIVSEPPPTSLYIIEKTEEKKEELTGDRALYHAIYERTKAGENYYVVLSEELPARSYATYPSWNWRLPTLNYLIVYTSPLIALILLYLLYFPSTVMWLWHWYQQRKMLNYIFGAISLFSILLLFPFLYKSKPIYLHEFWAGALIFLSFTSFFMGFKKTSLITALLALCIRELVIIYVVFMVALALFERRKKLVLGWLGVLVVFFVYLFIHKYFVYQYMPPDGASKGWFNFKEWSYILNTARCLNMISLFPSQLIAVVVPLCLVGVVGFCIKEKTYLGLYVFVFIGFLFFVGNIDNWYWGLLYSYILLFGFAYWLDGFRYLFKHAFGPEISKD